MRNDQGPAPGEGDSLEKTIAQSEANAPVPSEPGLADFEHPADITLRKVRRLSRVLPVAPPNVRPSTGLPAFATGALKAAQLSRGILVLCAQMRGVRPVTGDTTALPGFLIEARLQGRSFSRETAPPFRTAPIESGTISIGGFPTESHWKLEMPAQHAFEAVSVSFPLAFLEALQDIDRDLAARANHLVAEKISHREPMDVPRRLPFVKLQQLCLQDRPGNKLRAEAIALDLLADTIDRLTGKPAETSPSQTLVEHVRKTIEGRLSDPPGISELAQLFRVSQTRLKRSFSEAMGQPISVYVARRRMEVAWELVAIGVPLAKVADEVGYANPEAFSRAFRRHYGQCPSVARARQVHNAR